MSGAATPGALRRRIEILQPADVDDGAGGVVRGFAPLATVPAAIEPVTAAESREGAALGLKRLWKATVRGRGDVSGGHRILWAGRTLNVLSARPLDAAGLYEELLCEEFAP